MLVLSSLSLAEGTPPDAEAGESVQVDVTQESATLVPTDTPQPTPDPTPVSAPEPTPASTSTSTPAAEPDIPTPASDPTESAAATDTPAPTDIESPAPIIEDTPVPFIQGLVKLSKDTEIYADEAITTLLGTLAEDGVTYAVQTDEALQVTFTLDGKEKITGYCDIGDPLALADDELAAYLALPSDIQIEGYPLFALVFVASEESAAQADLEEAFSTQLAWVSADTVLYSGAERQARLGMVVVDGIVYVGKDCIAYTTDNETIQTAYLDAALQPVFLSEEEYREIALQSVVTYEGQPLPALQVELYNYTLEMYGFPGLGGGSALSKAQLNEKKQLTTSGMVKELLGLDPGSDYVDRDIFAYADSKEEAQRYAQAYGAELVYYYDVFGFALLRLGEEHSTSDAVVASADAATLLPAVYMNGIDRVEPDHPDAPVGKKTEPKSGALGFTIPTLQTWATIKTDDPFLADPSNTNHLLKRYANITSGYQYMHDVVGTYAAWGLTKGSSGVKVFVLDSGVLAAHEELSGKVADIAPHSSSGFNTSISGSTMNPHGTHVASIIAGKADNGKGGAGIAPGVTILAFRGDTSSSIGSFTYANQVYGLQKAIESGAYVINMSLGGLLYSPVMATAVNNTLNNGIPIFASTGNDGMQSFNYPANYNGVISVASTDNNNTRSFYSTYANATLSAPGSNILCAAWGGTPSTSTYQSYDGTSMSCPVATGCAALYYSARGTRDLNGDGDIDRADVDYLRKVLTGNTSKIVGSATGMGAGIINIGNVFLKMAGKPGLELITSGDAKHVSTKDKVRITCGWNGEFIVYTTDGTTPAIKNGQVTVGMAEYGSKSGSGATAFTFDVPLTGLAYGKRTIKALTVNAQGVKSAVASLSFTIDDLNPDSLSVTIGTQYLAKGKKFTFQAATSPASSLKPTWRIVSGGEFATLDVKKGILTAKAPGVVRLQASVVSADSDIIELSEPYQVTIVPLMVKSITYPSKVTLKTGQTLTMIPTITLTDKSLLSDPRSLAFKTSNVKIVTVDANGLMTAVAPGSAKITCTVLDGSGKSVSTTVTVKQPVTGVTITNYVANGSGYGEIVAGKKMTLKADIQPANASNKKVTWTVDDVSKANKIAISASGVLSVPSSISAGTVITVTCTSQDAESGKFDTTTFVVTSAPLAKLNITSGDPRAVYKNGSVVSGNIFSINVPGTAADDTQMQLENNADSRPVLWTSSNPSVLTVSTAGLVRAEKTGSAKITCTVMDGSGKTASATLKVIVPASNINVYTDSSKLYNIYPSIAFGKSRKFSATVGSTYGTPTIKNVTWSFELREYNDSYFSQYVYDMENSTYYTALNSSTYTKYIKISGGKVSVASGLYDSWLYASGSYYLKIIARATDGSGVIGYTYAELASPSLVGTISSSSNIYYRVGNSLYRISGSIRSTTSMRVSTSDTQDANFGMLYFYGTSWNDDFGATSSAPAVASPIDSVTRLYYSGYRCYVKVGSSYYPLYCIDIKGDKPGSATIKVFTNDGTNKTASFKVKVTN